MKNLIQRKIKEHRLFASKNLRADLSKFLTEIWSSLSQAKSSCPNISFQKLMFSKSRPSKIANSLSLKQCDFGRRSSIWKQGNFLHRIFLARSFFILRRTMPLINAKKLNLNQEKSYGVILIAFLSMFLFLVS